MLQFKVKEILLASGKKTPAAWLVKHCGMSVSKAYKIVNGKQKSIDLRDFSKLCENLHCTPNDLMYWKETARTKLPATHPCMTMLTPPSKNDDWFTLFKNLPADKVLALHKAAKEELENGASVKSNPKED